MVAVHSVSQFVPFGPGVGRSIFSICNCIKRLGIHGYQGSRQTGRVCRKRLGTLACHTVDQSRVIGRDLYRLLCATANTFSFVCSQRDHPRHCPIAMDKPRIGGVGPYSVP
jgi:hypothetical protein